MKTKYKLGHKILASILLTSLFLQSCLNSPIHPTSLEAKYENKHDFIKEQSWETGSHEHREDVRRPTPIPKDNALTLAENQLPIVQVKEVISSIDAQQFPTVNHTIRRSSSLANKKIAQEKRMRSAPREISSNLTKPQVDKKLFCLFKMDSGKRVKIYQQEGAWLSAIKEKIGLFKNKYKLPVYFELGMRVEQLASLPPPVQEKYLDVILPKASIGQLGYIYIGKKGLRGGMKRKKDKEKMTEEEEEEQEKSKPETQFERGKQAYKRWKEHRKEADSQEVIKWLNRAAGQGHQKAEDLLSKFEREIIKATEYQQNVSRQEIGGSSSMELSDREEGTYSRKRKSSTGTDQNNQSDNKVEERSKLTGRKKRKTALEGESKQQELDKKMVKVGLTDIPEEHLSLEYRVKETAYLELIDKDIRPYLEKKNKKSPTCFISYAEEDHYHEQWVERFAKILKKAGIEVLLDRWIIKNGNILTEFVENSIDTADWIIVVGTKSYLKRYTERAKSLEEKEHGVRLEVQLMNHLIRHSTAMSNKVIPILLEGTSKESLPPFLRLKIAVEFTKRDYFEEILKLIRDLYQIDNRSKSFKGFIEKFKKYSSAAAKGITLEERKKYKTRRTAKILEDDQKISEHIKGIKEKALNKSESSSDESPSDEGDSRQLDPRTIALRDSTLPRAFQLHNDLPLAKLKDYILRKDKEEELRKKLNETNVCVIYGHGGTGKSTLVAAYGRKQQNKQVVWWISAETPEKLIASYERLAEQLGINYQAPAQKFKHELSQYLVKLARMTYNSLVDHNQPTLLILDNATNPDLVSACLLLESSLLQFVITTRDKKSFKKYSPLELGTFTKEEAKEYIHRRLQTLNPSEIETLINKEKGVGLIPQKLKLATSSIIEIDAIEINGEIKLMNVKNYITKLQELKRQGKQEDEDFKFPEVKLGLETLNIPAQLLMRYSAYLDPDFIPLTLITKLLRLKKARELNDILNRLQKLSLITIINFSGREGIQIHREIQTACKEYQNWKEPNEYADKNLEKSLLETLAQCSPKLKKDSDNTKDQAKQYAANVDYALKNIDNAEKRDELKPFLAQIFDWMGDYNQLVQSKLYYYKKSFEIKKSLYPDNPLNLDIANSLHHIGYTYKMLSKYQTDKYQVFILSRKAFKSLKKAYEMRRDLDTTNMQELASSLHLLGLVCQDLGKYETGLNYLGQALEMMKNAHPNDMQQIKNDKLSLENRKQLITERLAKLTNKLDLSEQQFTPGDIIFLLNNSYFKEKVQILTLLNNPIGNVIVKGLVKALPYTQIQTLNLSSNNLFHTEAQALANALPKTQITNLDLSSNQIGIVGAQALANALPNTTIQILNLNWNEISDAGVQELVNTLPRTQIHTLNLRKTGISDSKAQELANALPYTEIQTLNLSENIIADAGAQELAKKLPDTNIQTLNLSYNYLSDTGAQALANALPKTQITNLDLSNNELLDAGAQALANVLSDTKITDLDLSLNQIGDAGAEALANVLRNIKITNFDINFNNLSDAGAQAFANVLPHIPITNFELSFHNLSDAEAQALANALPKTQITNLELNLNQIGDTGTQALSNFPSNTNATNLDLSGHQISIAEAQALANALPKTQITNLDLSNTELFDAGIQALAKVLPDTKIQILNLSSNNLLDAGAQAFANVLSDTKITNLDLSFDNLFDAAAEALANVLPSTNIQTLNLSYNYLSDTAAEALANVLPSTKIQILNLSYNYLSDAGAQTLANVLSNTQLQTADLCGNNIQIETKRSLKEKCPHIQWEF